MIQKKGRYFLFYKPFGVLCQFSKKGATPTLADYGPFPEDVYPAGRLDTDSEGLLLLTNDGAFKHRLLEPRYGHRRTYLVQVERVPGEDDLEPLRRGIVIEKKKTLPAEVRLLATEPVLPPRAVPIRFRAHIPTAWLELTVREGRNRQVRKMTAAIGFPTLRLVRSAIGSASIEGLSPGSFRELTPAAALRLLEE
jgi:23S rRNA pseudouridine2457 synthase